MYYSNSSGGDDFAQFLEKLEKAIDKEHTAIHCYDKMANNAPSHQEKQRILEIRQDELNHFDQFSYIYESYTGKRHNPKLVEECHDDYADMLKVAFENEQEAVDDYLEMSDLPLQSHIRRAFRRAAADEQNHAVWFLAFFTERKMKENFRFNDKWYI